jgi:hypothetical protein
MGRALGSGRSPGTLGGEMPYIEDVKRGYLDEVIDKLVYRLVPDSPDIDGKVNYVITKLLIAVYGVRGYDMIGDAIKALEMAKLEFYRKVAARWEDKKCAENGEVFPGLDKK